MPYTFNKTTVLPTDNPETARVAFRSLVYDQPFVLLVVLGDGAESEALVSKAGKFAGAASDLRWVVWARVLDHIKTEIGSFTETPDSGFKAAVLGGNAQAFSLSVQDTIRYVVPNGSPADNVAVLQAYLEAEQE
jgi:hypothetical protein